jgi:hypothetical protein
MSFVQAAGLAIRLFAVWLLIYAFQSGATAVTLLRSGSLQSVPGLVVFTPALIDLGLGLFLWRFPLALARLLVPRTSEQATSITLAECWKLASVCIGLLVFAQAGPQLLRCFALMLYGTQSGLDSLPWVGEIQFRRGAGQGFDRLAAGVQERRDPSVVWHADRGWFGEFAGAGRVGRTKNQGVIPAQACPEPVEGRESSFDVSL